MTFGKRVREAREKHGWSQGELARQLGVTPGCVSLWESGKREPKFYSVQRVSLALGVSGDWLLGFKDMP